MQNDVEKATLELRQILDGMAKASDDLVAAFSEFMDLREKGADVNQAEKKLIAAKKQLIECTTLLDQHDPLGNYPKPS